VAAAAVSAIERNRGEVDVAPIGMRVGTTLGGVAPRLSESITQRLGGDAIAKQMAAGQRSKR
jgi:hypothetical protein